MNSLINIRIKEERGKLYACFIDLRTAFDAVDRKLMVKKLRKLGIKGRMLKAIERIYQRMKNEVIVEGGITE